MENLLQELDEARRSFVGRGKRQAIVLSAPTGSGKTVMAAALIEAVLSGGDLGAAAGVAASPRTTFLWLSDSPELNEQSRHRIQGIIDGLPAARFEAIENTFDQPVLDEGVVYFLNYQKLRAGGRLVSPGDARATTFWETIDATQRARRGGLVVVVDEAHKGLGATAQERAVRRTIAATFMAGGPNAPLRRPGGRTEPFLGADLVIGISATPTRFDAFLQTSPDRLRRPVAVAPVDVRLSGLIKDQLLLYGLEHEDPPVMTLLAESVIRVMAMNEAWHAHTVALGRPPVVPLLMVQVEDAAGGRLSATPLDTVISEIAANWPELTSEAVVHCFGEAPPFVAANGWTIRRVDPNDIAAETRIRVVLFKTALNTGWDCPRAEVLMSFRRSDDPTPIAQLVGRMVRTPLTERVEGDEALNTAHLYLPRFNRERLLAVRASLAEEGADGVPVALQGETIELVVRPGGEAMHAALGWLPSMSVPPGRPIPDLRRAFALARLVQQEGFDSTAVVNLSSAMCDILDGSLQHLLDEDPEFEARVEARRNIRLSYLEVNEGDVEPHDDGPVAEINPIDVETAYRSTASAMGGEVPSAWLARRYQPEGDLTTLKLQFLELVGRTDILRALKALATDSFRALCDRYGADVAMLPEDRRVHFSALLGAGRYAQGTRVAFPARIVLPVEREEQPQSGHLYVVPGSVDRFQARLNDWERAVLDEERADGRFLCFVRNKDRQDWAVSYAYDLDGTKPGYPDFLVLRRGDDGEGMLVDVLEPHQGEDSCAKAKGMARFAEAFGDEYGRVQMIRKMEDGRLLRLSLHVEAVRRHVLGVVESTQDLLDAYREFGR